MGSSGGARSLQMLVGLPGASPGRAQSQQPPSQGELLLSVFMEFWLADGDSPLPGAAAPGGADPSSGPSTPNARSAARDGWKEYNDSWSGLLTMRSSSFRSASVRFCCQQTVCNAHLLRLHSACHRSPAQSEHRSWAEMSPQTHCSNIELYCYIIKTLAAMNHLGSLFATADCQHMVVYQGEIVCHSPVDQAYWKPSA